jgi:hypothetical protein
MEKHTTDLLRYIFGGIGMLIFIGMLTWCHLEEQKIAYDLKKPCVCDCEKK